MISRPITLALVLSAILLSSAGCTGGPPPATASDTAPGSMGVSAESRAALIRSRGYALLYSTVKDEADVAKSLILKSADTKVEDLLKAISKANTEAKARLEEFAKADPEINLKDQDLPVMELKARESISSELTKEVLFSNGKNFEFTILLTQHEALNYVAHLAKVLALLEPDAGRKAYLEEFSKTSEALHAQVMALLKRPYVGAAR